MEAKARQKLVLSLAAHLAVASRGLIPQPLLGDQGQDDLLNQLAGIFGRQNIRQDETAFAQSTRAFQLRSKEGCQALEKLIAHWQEDKIKPEEKQAIQVKQAIKEVLKSPLLLSELWEVLTNSSFSRQSSSRQTSENSEALAQTQFFTPPWVAGIIADSISYHQGATTVDPACGTGHLLLAVLDKHLSLSDKSESAQERVLAEVLKERLFGYEIDPALLEICALSIYLRARDVTDGELPLPNLFLTAADAAGSLSLGVENSPAEKAARPLFDNVIMNPPYQSTRTMDGATSAFLKRNYPNCQGDLYTAFLELALRLLKGGGTLCTITQQSFFSIQRYRQFRLDLLEQMSFEKIIALGTGVFKACPGDKVNSAIITARKKRSVASATPEKQQTQKTQEDQEHSFVYCKDGTSHILKESKLRANTLAIAGNPYIFEAPDALIKLFTEYPALKEFAPGINIVNGLFTCNNKLFVKDKSAVHAAEADIYVPYDKGGGRKWYFETPLRLRWEENGDKIRDYRASRGQTRTLPGAEYYFKEGITYSYIGTSGFRARLLSSESIFDIASSAVFSESLSLYYLLAFFNSSTVIYLLSILNPTINFQIGDLRRLPFKAPHAALEAHLDQLARAAVQIVKEGYPLSDADKRKEEDIQNEIDELVFAHYEIDRESQKEIKNNSWVKNARARSI